MWSRFTLFLFILFLVVAAGQRSLAATTKVNELLQEANQFYAEAKDNLALQKFEEVLKLEPSCYEALWKSSLLNSRIGTRYSDVISKLNYYDKAWNFADQAMCAFSGAEANYVMALAIYNKALALNVKERMQNSKVIKFYLDEAICANPTYAVSHDCHCGHIALLPAFFRIARGRVGNHCGVRLAAKPGEKQLPVSRG